jgi:hypothetical protein
MRNTFIKTVSRNLGMKLKGMWSTAGTLNEGETIVGCK